MLHSYFGGEKFWTEVIEGTVKSISDQTGGARKYSSFGHLGVWVISYN